MGLTERIKRASLRRRLLDRLARYIVERETRQAIAQSTDGGLLVHVAIEQAASRG